MVSAREGIVFFVSCFVWNLIQEVQSSGKDDDDYEHHHRPHDRHHHDHHDRHHGHSHNDAIIITFSAIFIFVLLLLIYCCLRKRSGNRHHPNCPARRGDRFTRMRFVRFPISADDCEYCRMTYQTTYQQPPMYGSIVVPNTGLPNAAPNMATAPPDYNFLYPQKQVLPEVHQPGKC